MTEFFTTQQTLRQPVKCTGIGVHSGAPATLLIKPAPVDHGITFIRTDITDRNNVISAKWDNVTDTQLCTVLTNEDGVSVSTVEHLLSAMSALGIHNASIEIDSQEMPIMDGSAEPFVFLIECTGITDQKAPLKAIRIIDTVTYEEDGKTSELRPSNTTSYSFDIDFGDTLVGKQSFALDMQKSRYKAEISQARTFGFLHEVEALRDMGLCRGGSLENAIVIDGNTIMNENGLRYPDEFVRHKILDAIGDLYLAGLPIIGHFHGDKAGHAMNNKILHKLFASPECFEIVTLSSPSMDAVMTPVATEIEAPMQAQA